jgi:transcriptional regulator with XRE-family HTH domain
MAYQNLIAEMKRQGITPKSIAEAVDKSPDTISNWLKGKGEFPVGKAFKVQEKFFPSLPISYLFNPKPITPPVADKPAV